jgi:hypothetical protein
MPGQSIAPASMLEEIVMVNEMNGVGSGYTAGVSQYSSGPPEKTLGADSSLNSAAKSLFDKPEVRINAAKGLFSALSDSKDMATQVAQTVRGVSDALDKVDSVLKEMQTKIDQVKDYPPYPAGNEARVKYLNSIDGLRKELQSLVIPPIKDGNAPVFFPQEGKFPPLDAKTPSDAAVLAFGEAVQSVKGNLDTARAVLQAQSDQLSAKASIHLPHPPAESQAQSISGTVSDQLAGTTQSLAGSTDVLSHL